MKIGKRGNGQWIRIPAAIVRELKIKPGDKAELVAVREDGFEIRLVPSQPELVEKTIKSIRRTPKG
jgi:antitoxin component of MazEF toxin-antitoxin module